jgi:hypothetical protein
MTNPTIPAGRTVRFLLLLAAAALGPAASASGQGWFAYTDQYRVVTLEFKGENLAILNVINLGDTAFVVEPSAVLMVKTGGQVIPGQVFASKDTSGATIYRASLLVPARSSGGTDLLGAFQLRQDALKVYMLLAGRYLELAGQRRDQFESLLGRLGELNLNEPPRVLRRPAPQLTPAARDARYNALLMVTIRLDKAGNIVGVSFSPEPGYGMADRIRETILNSWQFLPATYNGEVVATEIKVNLQIGEPGGTGKTEIP